jgi:VanZ family protein
MPRSVEPQPSWLTQIPHFDKFVHWSLYAVLSFLFYISKQEKQTIVFFIINILFAFVLGGSIELIQPYVGRSKELMDLIADMIGCFCGIPIYYIYQQSPPKNKQRK